jgi:hypothetical protein
VAKAWGYRILELLNCEAQHNVEALLFVSGIFVRSRSKSFCFVWHLPDGCVSATPLWC